jgi:hypothetical protein
MAEFDGVSELVVTYQHEGSVGFGNTVTVPTTALQDGDIILLFGPFPERAKVFNAAGEFVYETGTLDSGTPALVLSLGFIDSGDAALDVVIQAGVDEDDTGETDQVAGEGAWIDVAGKYLAAEITTSASAGAASDTIEVGGRYYVNVKEQSQTAA